MFWIYNLLLPLLAPLWAPWMLWRSYRRKEKPDWGERFGRYRIRPSKDRMRIWLHAVSVGEVMAAAPILRELRKQLPESEILLSVTTSSGHSAARQKAEGLYDHLVYFPIDLLRLQMRAMERVRPAVVAVMESELWLNFFWSAKAFGARTLVLNGRISDRTFPRARKLGSLYRTILSHVDRCLMQTEKDAERMRALGGKSVEVVGNTKFDEAAESLGADAEHWRRELKLPEEKPVIVVGSTRGEEEERLVLDALKGIVPERAAAVLAPRHLERAQAFLEAARSRLGAAGLRSAGVGGPCIVLDTYGELASVYAVADVAVVGGGFENHGGQNLLQPLAHGKPVLHGPHFQNFAEAASAARDAGATRVCREAGELRDSLLELLESPEARSRMGEAAAAFVQSHLGASGRYAEAIAEEARLGGE